MNTSPHFGQRSLASKPPTGQRGVVLVFALIALTIMMVGAVGLISSIKSSLVSAGNISFKRDLVNQAELAAGAILLQFSTPGSGVGTAEDRGTDTDWWNYSAMTLPTTPEGIPNDLLLRDDDFWETWDAYDIETETGITLRYLVDRLCTQEGNSQELAPEDCLRAPTEGGSSVVVAGDAINQDRQAERGRAAPPGVAGGGTEAAVRNPAVYRLTIRGTGARDTQAFYQVVFTEPLPAPPPLP